MVVDSKHGTFAGLSLVDAIERKVIIFFAVFGGLSKKL